jgi:uncharacterized membrane protein YcaP (DUF421 family)
MVPIVLLIVIQIAMSYGSLHSHHFRQLIDGKPSIIIDRGVIDSKAMKKARYSLDDLMEQMRAEHVASFEEIEFAILEPSGRLSVIKRRGVNEAAKAQARDLSRWKEQDGEGNLPSGYKFTTVPVTLISDGHLLREELDNLDKDKRWLMEQLWERGINDIRDVFLLTLNHRGQIYVQKKELGGEASN